MVGGGHFFNSAGIFSSKIQPEESTLLHLYDVNMPVQYIGIFRAEKN